MFDVSTGNFSFIATWKIYHDDSKLVLDYQGERDLGSHSGGPFAIGVQPREYQSASQATFKTVTLVMGFNAGWAADGVEIGLSHGSGVGVSVTSAGESRRYSKDFDLTVQCLVDQPKQRVKLPSGLLKHPVYFKFKKATLDGGQLSDLKGWYDKLEEDAPPLFAAIRDGRCPLILSGYASTPGRPDDNRELSDNRIKAVRLELESRLFESRKLRITTAPYGEDRALQDGEADAEQRVEVWIKPAHAEKAMTGTKERVD
jgi:outer membrane protein OmpA-like peptidoglycan-associated protein